MRPWAFGIRNSLHSMDAGLEPKRPVGQPATDLEDDFLEAADVRGALAEDIDLPAALFAIAKIHAVQIGREQT